MVGQAAVAVWLTKVLFQILLLAWLTAPLLFNWLARMLVSTWLARSRVHAWSTKPKEAKALAKARKAEKAIAQAKAHAQVQAQKRSDRLYGKRRVSKKSKGIRSVSDLLDGADTVKSKAVRPNIHQRLPCWAKEWKWPEHSYGQDDSGAVSSRSGGGSGGYVASYNALQDVFACERRPAIHVSRLLKTSHCRTQRVKAAQ